MENINIKVILDEVYSSIISLADDGGIELRNYDIAIIRFNF